MQISNWRIWRLTPPSDTWFFLQVETTGGLTGWGEFTGSGHDEACATIIAAAMAGMDGKNVLDTTACMSGYMAFHVPAWTDRACCTAWSAIAQALWDIKAKALNLPLSGLLGGPRSGTVPLYANLNRGLLGDRSPQAFARNAAAALKEGYVFVKSTPFDAVTPRLQAVLDVEQLKPAFARMRETFAAVPINKVAVDCHRRLNPGTLELFLNTFPQEGLPVWLEDIFAEAGNADIPAFRARHPQFTLAGGEEIVQPDKALALLSAPHSPDVFMPDVKYIVDIAVLKSLLQAASGLGLRTSLHNPSGPVSTAFSAHLCLAAPTDLPLEFCHEAVKNRNSLSLPHEPVENGKYYVSDAPGIGLAPSQEFLSTHGRRFEPARWS